MQRDFQKLKIARALMDEIRNCEIQSKRQNIREAVHRCLGDGSYMPYWTTVISDIAWKISAQCVEGERKEKEK